MLLASAQVRRKTTFQKKRNYILLWKYKTYSIKNFISIGNIPIVKLQYITNNITQHINISQSQFH